MTQRHIVVTAQVVTAQVVTAQVVTGHVVTGHHCLTSSELNCPYAQ